MNTNLKAFLVGMLAVVLAMGPWVAHASHQPVVDTHALAEHVANIVGIDNLVDAGVAAQDEWISFVNAKMAPGALDARGFDMLGAAIDYLYLTAVGRAREPNELYISFAGELRQGEDVHIKTQFGEALRLHRTVDLEEYDLEDDVDAASMIAAGYGMLVAMGKTLRRSILVVEGPVGAVTVDSLVLYTTKRRAH